MRVSFKLRTGWLAGILLAVLIAALAGCDEDDTETKSPPAPAPESTLPPGAGSLEAPYILQYGATYTGIPVPPGGSVFLLTEDIPAGWSGVATDSSVDINLVVSGFETFFGEDSGDFGSFTPDSGSEQITVLGDGTYTDMFAVVDSTMVRTDGETFDISVTEGAAPAGIAVSLSACTSIPGPPDSMCRSMGFGYFDVDVPFPMAPTASLSVGITETTAKWVFFSTRNWWDSTDYAPFSSNEPTLLGYGDGFCHVNAGATVTTGTCTVNPVVNYDQPRIVRVVNNTGSSPVDVTLSFSSP